MVELPTPKTKITNYKTIAVLPVTYYTLMAMGKKGQTFDGIIQELLRTK